MARVLVSSAIDRGFEPQSGQKTKDYKIGICCFSAKHATLMNKSKYWLTGNECVRVEQHVYTRTVSASYPYKNQIQPAGLVHLRTSSSSYQSETRVRLCRWRLKNTSYSYIPSP